MRVKERADATKRMFLTVALFQFLSISRFKLLNVKLSAEFWAAFFFFFADFDISTAFGFSSSGSTYFMTRCMSSMTYPTQTPTKHAATGPRKMMSRTMRLEK